MPEMTPADWDRFLSTLENLTKANAPVCRCKCTFVYNPDELRLCPNCGTPSSNPLDPLERLTSVHKMLLAKRLEIDGLELPGEPRRPHVGDESSLAQSSMTAISDSTSPTSATMPDDLMSAASFAASSPPDTTKSKVGLIELFRIAAARDRKGKKAVVPSLSPGSTTRSNSFKWDVEDWMSAANDDSTAVSLPPVERIASSPTNSPFTLVSVAQAAPQPPPLVPPPVPPPAQKLFMGAAGLIPTANDIELREYNFSKCFPIYRKQFIHPTQPRSFLQRSAKFPLFCAISPDASKIIMAGRQKLMIYAIPPDYNDPPILRHSTPLMDEPLPSSDAASISSSRRQSEELDVAGSSEWENPYVGMTDNIAVVATPTGHLRVYKLDTGYPVLYNHKSNFGFHCMAVSPRGSIIACAILGRDKSSADAQPMIMLHCLKDRSLDWSESNVRVITLTIPYRDAIGTLSFSADELYLSCSTRAEFRFMVISVINPYEPRLVMKSSRRPDAEPETEGITSVEFFPGNPRYMTVTSVANTGPPVVLDSRVSPNSRSIHSATSAGVSHPSVAMRVDKVGCAIHRAEISPRGDAVAFLDKRGLVYMMHSPGMVSDIRKITIVTEVSGASSLREAAAVRFSPSGHILVVADRKGNVHIEDFGAALPHQAGMGKCRILS